MYKRQTKVIKSNQKKKEIDFPTSNIYYVPLHQQPDNQQFLWDQLNTQAFKESSQQRRNQTSEGYQNQQEQEGLQQCQCEQCMKDILPKGQKFRKDLESFYRTCSNKQKLTATEANKDLMSNPNSFQMTNLQKGDTSQRVPVGQNTQACKTCCLHSKPTPAYPLNVSQEFKNKIPVKELCSDCQLEREQRAKLQQIQSMTSPNLQEYSNVAETNSEMYDHFKNQMQDKIFEVKQILRMHKLPKYCCKTYGHSEQSYSSIPQNTLSQKRMLNRSIPKYNENEANISNRSYQITQRKGTSLKEEDLQNSKQMEIFDEGSLEQIQKAAQNLRNVSGEIQNQAKQLKQELSQTKQELQSKLNHVEKAIDCLDSSCKSQCSSFLL